MFRARLCLTLFLLAGLGLAGGCARDKCRIELNNRFSINVARVPECYPGEKANLSPAQEEVIFRRGRPDFVRFWWRPDGSLVRTADLNLTGERPDLYKSEGVKLTWIYLRDNEEVFYTGGGYTVKPIDEITKLICTYGDPSDRKPPAMRHGRKVEVWQWIEYGLQVRLVDNKVDSIKHFPATGSGTYLGK